MGSGTLAKLINQQLVGIHCLAACEALKIIKVKNLDLNKLNSLLEKSWGFSKIQNRIFSTALMSTKEENHRSCAPLRNLHKDLTIVHQMCSDLGMSLPIISETTQVL